MTPLATATIAFHAYQTVTVKNTNTSGLATAVSYLALGIIGLVGLDCLNNGIDTYNNSSNMQRNVISFSQLMHIETHQKSIRACFSRIPGLNDNPTDKYCYVDLLEPMPGKPTSTEVSFCALEALPVNYKITHLDFSGLGLKSLCPELFSLLAQTFPNLKSVDFSDNLLPATDIKRVETLCTKQS